MGCHSFFFQYYSLNPYFFYLLTKIYENTNTPSKLTGERNSEKKPALFHLLPPSLLLLLRPLCRHRLHLSLCHSRFHILHLSVSSISPQTLLSLLLLTFTTDRHPSRRCYRSQYFLSSKSSFFSVSHRPHLSVSSLLLVPCLSHGERDG